MKKTLQTKLLFWFLVFSFLTILSTITFNAFYFRKKANISNLVSEITELHVSILKTFMHLDDFFALETTSEAFFETGHSINLESCRQNVDHVRTETERLARLSNDYNLEVSEELLAISQEMDRYDQTIIQMLELIMYRGFKDYGLEGEMREYAHILENFERLNQAKVLSLRRHEKDYIIRNQLEYVAKLNELGEEMQKDVRSSASLKKWEKDSIISIVSNYVVLFNRLVELDREIGIRNHSEGYISRLNQMGNTIEERVDLMIQEADLKRDAIFRQLEILYAAFFAVLIAAALILSLNLSKRITEPLKNLTTYIGTLIKSKFRKVHEFKIEKSHHEIEVLNSEFMEMISMLLERESQRDEAEDALRESELKYRELVELLPLSVFETDPDGNLTYVNRAWENHFGYRWEDLHKGLNLSSLIQGEWMSEVTVSRIDGKEYQAARRDGSHFSILIYSEKILKNGELLGFRGIVVDIEDQKKYIEELKREKMKAEESDRLKSAFLANMSHEIRTPMNAIMGFSDLLSKLDLGSAKRREFIKQIKNSGNLLLNLIDDIIDIAKIEAGEIKIQNGHAYINQIIDELQVTFSELVKKEGKAAKLEVRGTMGCRDNDFAILTDPLRLKQILSNLIGNGIKFTEKGEVEFGYNRKGEELELFVRDTGIGLSKENQELIFERFRQVEDPYTRKYGGTGLGLSISRHLVELLGGRIWVESEPFKGTTFFFTLPNHQVFESRSGSIKLESNPVVSSWKSNRLLIVEDDSANARLLKEALEHTGIQMDWVTNGQEAVDYCQNGRLPDIVLMDLQMPVMNGHIATRILKEKFPEMPIIAQTAYAMAGEKEKCIEAGCDDYIAKPVNFKLLKSKIHQMIFAAKPYSEPSR